MKEAWLIFFFTKCNAYISANQFWKRYSWYRMEDRRKNRRKIIYRSSIHVLGFSSFFFQELVSFCRLHLLLIWRHQQWMEPFTSDYEDASFLPFDKSFRILLRPSCVIKSAGLSLRCGPGLLWIFLIWLPRWHSQIGHNRTDESYNPRRVVVPNKWNSVFPVLITSWFIVSPVR